MERRLAAILLTDMVGYSQLIGLDEEGTIARQKSHRDGIIDPKIAAHGGRIVKTTGDGVLVEFPSVVEAVQCAVAVQEEMAACEAAVPAERRIHYRIGINLGDIIIDGDDILGDGVNVAAWLEGLAKPGGICISGSVHDQLPGKMHSAFEDAGEQTVKNITRPVRVWHWKTDTPQDVLPANALLNKPSIAVLPFVNMSGDPEQEYFADGIAEEVITALSRFRSLFVIARASSFTYKGAAVDIAQVARELGVRYVIEGSVRKAANRVRITAQLIDAAQGNHLWADRFDGGLDDVFDLQDQITEQIVIAVEPEISLRERDRARRQPPDSLDAWALLQRGLSHHYRANDNDRAEAIRLFREAVALDPEFAAAHAHLAYALWASRSLTAGYAEAKKVAASARASAERAILLDPNEPLAHLTLGRLHIFAGETEMGIDEMQTAVAINPNFAWGHHFLGWAYWFGAGQAERALPHFDAALRLSPRSPLRWLPLGVKGSALRFLGRHDEAVAHCRQACQLPDSGFLPHLHLATALAEAGRKSEAQVAMAKTMEMQPALSPRFIHDNFFGAHETYLKSLLESLRKAGMPE
jgi:TolB-like protein/Tfp pilus assembly protein PilF